MSVRSSSLSPNRSRRHASASTTTLSSLLPAPWTCPVSDSLLAKNNRPPTGGAVSISYGYVLDTVKVDLINAIRLLLSFWATVRYQRNSATGP
ncbi:uncharacterized protein EURHEDRAFT_411716, partial [Aspergillus ruber CBS 135680]